MKSGFTYFPPALLHNYMFPPQWKGWRSENPSLRQQQDLHIASLPPTASHPPWRWYACIPKLWNSLKTKAPNLRLYARQGWWKPKTNNVRYELKIVANTSVRFWKCHRKDKFPASNGATRLRWMVTFSIRILYPRHPLDRRLGGRGREENFPFIFSQALYWQSCLPRLIIWKLLFSSSTCEIIEISGRGGKTIFAVTPLANVEKYAIFFTSLLLLVSTDETT
jgi:hypothetical protein